MLIQLIRNQPQGSAITGRLVINGRWFCNTLERVGYQIPALCYHLAVTQSPKFRRLLPIVQNVPQRSGIRFHRGTKPEHSTGCILVVADNPSRARELIGAEVVENNVVEVVDHSDPCRSRDIDSSGNNRSNECEIRTLSPLSSKHIPVGARSAADVETQLTQLLLQTQNAHEEIILEVSDFRPGTEYGYNTMCPP